VVAKGRKATHRRGTGVRTIAGKEGAARNFEKPRAVLDRPLLVKQLEEEGHALY